jgi:hypothetical protein
MKMRGILPLLLLLLLLFSSGTLRRGLLMGKLQIGR